MPIYDYACKVCDNTFSETQRIDDRKVPIERGCSECGCLYANGQGCPGDPEERALYQVLGSPNICYSMTTRRTDDDFNSKLKELRDKVPAAYKDNLSKNIR